MRHHISDLVLIAETIDDELEIRIRERFQDVLRDVVDSFLLPLLLRLGLLHESINWLSSFEYVIPAVIVAGARKSNV